MGDASLNPDIATGAYVIYGVPADNSRRDPDIVIVATGSEVPLAVAAAKLLEDLQQSVRVISMPCQELHLRQPLEYRQRLFPRLSCRVSIEAGTTRGWERIVGGGPCDDALHIGVDEFGFSAPAKNLCAAFGLQAESVVLRIRNHFGF